MIAIWDFLRSEPLLLVFVAGLLGLAAGWAIRIPTSTAAKLRSEIERREIELMRLKSKMTALYADTAMTSRQVSELKVSLKTVTNERDKTCIELTDQLNTTSALRKDVERLQNEILAINQSRTILMKERDGALADLQASETLLISHKAWSEELGTRLEAFERSRPNALNMRQTDNSVPRMQAGRETGLLLPAKLAG